MPSSRRLQSILSALQKETEKPFAQKLSFMRIQTKVFYKKKIKKEVNAFTM